MVLGGSAPVDVFLDVAEQLENSNLAKLIMFSHFLTYGTLKWPVHLHHYMTLTLHSYTVHAAQIDVTQPNPILNFIKI